MAEGYTVSVCVACIADEIRLQGVVAGWNGEGFCVLLFFLLTRARCSSVLSYVLVVVALASGAFE